MGRLSPFRAEPSPTVRAQGVTLNAPGTLGGLGNGEAGVGQSGDGAAAQSLEGSDLSCACLTSTDLQEATLESAHLDGGGKARPPRSPGPGVASPEHGHFALENKLDEMVPLIRDLPQPQGHLTLERYASLRAYRVNGVPALWLCLPS